MKKYFFIVACSLFVSQSFSQQNKFGLTAGYLNLNVSSSYQGSENSENASGFYAGILGDFEFSEAFHVEPAAIYGKAENSDMLYIPVLVKYNLGQSGINLLAGPQATMLLGEIHPRVKRIGWDLSFGAGYDFTENIFLRARYAIEISNRHNNQLIGAPAGIKSSVNSLLAGVGYKF